MIKRVFQNSENQIIGAKMQLIIVLTSFICSLSVAIAFAEESPNSQTEVLIMANQNNQ